MKLEVIMKRFRDYHSADARKIEYGPISQIYIKYGVYENLSNDEIINYILSMFNLKINYINTITSLMHCVKKIKINGQLMVPDRWFAKASEFDVLTEEQYLVGMVAAGCQRPKAEGRIQVPFPKAASELTEGVFDCTELR